MPPARLAASLAPHCALSRAQSLVVLPAAPRRYNADVFGRIYDVNGEAAIDDVSAGGSSFGVCAGDN
jgi:hypothetical protein